MDITTLYCRKSLPPTASSSWRCSAEALTSRANPRFHRQEVLKHGGGTGLGALHFSFSQWLAAQLKGCNAIGFWLSTQDFLLEELLKEAWTYTVANPWEVIECDELRHKPAHHLATIIGFDQTTSKEVQMILK